MNLSTLLSLAALVVAAPALAQGSVFPSKAQRELSKRLNPDEVSAEARGFLKGKMKAHAKDMRELSMAVAVLNWAQVKRYAQGIVNQPRLDPSAGKAAALPPSYFALQDNLKKFAGELVLIADQQDSDEVVTAYAHLVQTCASCHYAFLTTKKPAPAKPAEAAPTK